MKQEESEQVTLIPLAQLPVGSRVSIKQIKGGKKLSHRLLSLGLRVGSDVDLLQRRSSGVVVANRGIRVALSSGVAEKLLTLPLPAQDLLEN